MNNEDTLRPEYSADLIQSGERGKYAKRYHEGTNIVSIHADLYRLLPDTQGLGQYSYTISLPF